MSSVPPGLRLLAEEMFFVTPPPPNANREVRDEYVLHTPASGAVAFTGIGRVRLAADDVEKTVEELRVRFGALGRDSVAWWVGPSSTPAGLAQQLRDFGLRPLDHPSAEPRYTAMTLTSPPAEPPPGVTARRVRDLDEFRTATRIYFAVNVPDRDPETVIPDFAEFYERRHVSGDSVSYLAWVDGEAAAAGNAHVTPEGAALNGGFTLPHLRGRGAYRALVRARWEDAVAAGAPGLAVLAGGMSRPILERLGFQSLGEVEVLVDELGSARTAHYA